MSLSILIHSTRCHCERSEAISPLQQTGGDCFVSPAGFLAMTGELVAWAVAHPESRITEVPA
jgi:hypothetical protein